MEHFAPETGSGGQERYGVRFADGSIEKSLLQEHVTGDVTTTWMDALFDEQRPSQVCVRNLFFVDCGGADVCVLVGCRDTGG